MLEPQAAQAQHSGASQDPVHELAGDGGRVRSEGRRRGRQPAALRLTPRLRKLAPARLQIPSLVLRTSTFMANPTID